MVVSNQLLKSSAVLAGGLALFVSVFTTIARAQDSLPFDIDLASDATEEPAAETAETGGETPAAPAALSPAAPTAPAQPEARPEPVQQVAPGTESTAETTTPAAADADLTSFLMGQNVDTVVPMLEDSGWMIVARTPGLVQMDRGQQELDLTVDSTNGKVVDAALTD